jgi:hypothetical protein
MTQEAAIKFKDEIKAFQEGKQIQVFTRKWVDDNNPSFSIKSKYRVKPVEKQEQKRIIELSDDGETWFEATSFIPKCEKLHARVRVETQPTKRLPTIEEVKKWFLENRAFRYKDGMLCRIFTIDVDSHPIGIDGDYETIEEFCRDYTHYDGSSLYITE